MPKKHTCRFCHKPFTKKRMGQKECSPKCSYDFLCTQEGKDLVMKVRQKRVKDEAKKISKEQRELKRANLGWQHEKTQNAFNKMRKLEEYLWFAERGMEPECISCGKQNMAWACGHFISRGSSSNLRYERDNTFLQCNFRCNSNLSGNRKGDAKTRGYEAGLIERFGLEEGKRIIGWCEENKSKVRDWTCEELEAMRKQFNALSRELTKKIQRYGGE